MERYNKKMCCTYPTTLQVEGQKQTASQSTNPVPQHYGDSFFAPFFFAPTQLPFGQKGRSGPLIFLQTKKKGAKKAKKKSFAVKNEQMQEKDKVHFFALRSSSIHVVEERRSGAKKKAEQYTKKDSKNKFENELIIQKTKRIRILNFQFLSLFLSLFLQCSLF